MKSQRNYSLVILSILVLSSCAGSKKIDYDSSYKFSKYKYSKSANVELPQKNHKKSSVLTDAPESYKESFNIPESICEISSEDQSETFGMLEIDALTREYKQLDRKVKRDIRKQVKAELKQMDMLEASTKLSVNDNSAVEQLEGNTKLALLIGGGGLLLLILGAIFSAGFLSLIGALAIVAGAVLYIIDQS